MTDLQGILVGLGVLGAIAGVDLWLIIRLRNRLGDDDKE